MELLLEKFKRLQLPPHQEKVLGLQPDWKNKITREFVDKVYEVAIKNAGALRELEKY